MITNTDLALIATALAFCALALSHFVAAKLTGSDLPKLICYVIGCALIAVIFSTWCLLAGHRESMIAFLLILAGAGLGTGFAYAVDHWDGVRTEVAIRRGQQKAETDRDS